MLADSHNSLVLFQKMFPATLRTLLNLVMARHKPFGASPWEPVAGAQHAVRGRLLRNIHPPIAFPFCRGWRRVGHGGRKKFPIGARLNIQEWCSQKAYCYWTNFAPSHSLPGDSTCMEYCSKDALPARKGAERSSLLRFASLPNGRVRPT